MKTETYYSSDGIRKLGAVYNLIYGKRSKGKSYDMLYNIISAYWEGRKHKEIVQAVFIRRKLEALKGVAIKTMCDALICNGIGENAVKEITGGEFDDIKIKQRQFYLCKTDPVSGLTKYDREPFMTAIALAQYDTHKGAAFPHVKTIWFDEFIEVSEVRYLKDEFKLFQNTISTIVRRRTDVTIWMTGNTVDPYCPYFEEMGLDRILDQKQGTIDLYKLGRSGKTIAVERTQDTGRFKNSSVSNDYYFAFDNPELRMITEGDWEISAYPLCQEDIRRQDICGRFFVHFKKIVLQGDIVSNGDEAYIYLHADLDPLEPEDVTLDLIYSTEISMRPNFRRKFTTIRSDCEKIINDLVQADKILYDSGKTGNAFAAYLKWCSTI